MLHQATFSQIVDIPASDPAGPSQLRVKKGLVYDDQSPRGAYALENYPDIFIPLESGSEDTEE